MQHISSVGKEVSFYFTEQSVVTFVIRKLGQLDCFNGFRYNKSILGLYTFSRFCQLIMFYTG